MRIGLFINNFYNVQNDKDPGIIARSLAALGHEVTIYCFKTETINLFRTGSPDSNGLELKIISTAQMRSVSFWSAEKKEIILIYSWLSLRFTPLLKALKSAGVKTVLKLDSDGRLLYPFLPSYLRVAGITSTSYDKLVYALRLIQWYIFPKLISHRRLEQLTIADAVIIESPRARKNLQHSLNFWQREDLKNKIYFIPNPLDAEINTINSLNEKNNLIISIARWDDKRKNAVGLVKTLTTLAVPADWEILLIGGGANKLLTRIIKQKPTLKITTQEQIAHQDIFSYLARAKIFLAPSLADSFNLAALEALGCGCSLAATPLESFEFFIGGGKYGTLAADSDPKNIGAALLTEIDKWQQKKYQPEIIAHYWREELGATRIGQTISDLFKSL